MVVDKNALAHFERVGRALADSHVVDPPPKDFRDMLARMLAINPNCGKGTKDPMGGDMPSHIAYLKFRAEWLRKNEEHETA